MSAIAARLVSYLDTPQGRRVVAGLLLLTALVGLVSWGRRAGDFAGYVEVGQALLSGQDPYRDTSGVNTWPPVFSFLCVPLAVMAKAGAYPVRVAWLLFNYAALVVLVETVAAVTDRGTHGAGRGWAVTRAAGFVPLVLTYRYTAANFEHLQVNIAVVALTLTGLYWDSRGRSRAGGALVGVAAAIKLWPVAFVPYLAWRRRYRAAIGALVVGALLSLSPAAVVGWAAFSDYVSAWRDALTLGWGVGPMNQSVLALWDRVLGHGFLPLVSGGVGYLPLSGARAVQAAWLASLAVIGLAAALAWRRRPAPDSLDAVGEWAALFLVVALGGPVTWEAYLVVMIVGNGLLFRTWRYAEDQLQRKAAALTLAISFALSGLTAPSLLGSSLSGRMEMAGVDTLSGLALLTGLFFVRWHRLARDDRG